MALPATRSGIVPLDVLKRRYLQRALELCGGNKSEAARRLGINRSTLYEVLADDAQ